jgi:hypothetical protein
MYVMDTGENQLIRARKARLIGLLEQFLEMESVFKETS